MQIGQQQSRINILNSLKPNSRILLKPIVQSTLNVNLSIITPQNSITQDYVLQQYQDLNKPRDSTFKSTSKYHSIIQQQETSFIIKTSRNFDRKNQNQKLQSLSPKKSQPKGILKYKTSMQQQNKDLQTNDTNDMTFLNTKRTKVLCQSPSFPSKLSFQPLLIESNSPKKVSFSAQVHFKTNDDNFCFQPKRYVLSDLDDIK